MKKTIAKIMAAAMVLSAVPAVALPTLTAEAADATKVTVSYVKTDTTDLDSDGDTGVDITGDGTVSYETVESSKQSKVINFSFDGELADYVVASIDKDGNVILAKNSEATDVDKKIATAVRDKKNTVDVKITVKSSVTDLKAYTDEKTTEVTPAVSTGTAFSIGTFRIGGVAESTTSHVIKSGIKAADGNLHDGDVYAEVTSTTNLEVSILQGKNSDLDSNDDLRGETLDLTTVKIGGIEYKVTKLGAQSLKKAHMKKFVAENAKQIGKGALRGAKQVKKVDISDSNKVRKIHSKAFYGDKNLKTITIDGRKLNTVGSGAFSGVKKNCTIKIKAKKTKYNSDVKLIKKSGAKNVKFTRVAP